MAIINARKSIVSREKWYVITFFFTSMVLLLVTGCGGGNNNDTKSQKKVPLVVVETVKEGEIVRSLDLTAEIMPIKTIQISSMVEGPLKFCPWREGDRAEDGEKLIEIEREIYRAEVKAAETALIVAQAKLADMRAGTRPEEIEKARQDLREAEQNLAFERNNYERTAQLVDTGALPGENLEEARVKLTAAEAKFNSSRKQLEMLEEGPTQTAIAVQQAMVKEASAKLDQAKAHLNECIITAPFAGTITKVYVHKGDMAAEKTPLLEMADLDTLVIRCAVPELHSSSVQKGMRAEVRLDALPGKLLSAEVVRVFPELDPRMRTRTVELEIREEVDLAPGMFGRIRLILESISNAITVPIQSVIVSPAGDQIAFVVKDGKALQRSVQAGIEEGGRVHILSGLKPGEKVIVSGQEKLKDGRAIRLPGNGQSKDKPSSGEEHSP